MRFLFLDDFDDILERLATGEGDLGLSTKNTDIKNKGLTGLTIKHIDSSTLWDVERAVGLHFRASAFKAALF